MLLVYVNGHFKTISKVKPQKNYNAKIQQFIEDNSLWDNIFTMMSPSEECITNKAAITNYQFDTR